MILRSQDAINITPNMSNMKELTGKEKYMIPKAQLRICKKMPNWLRFFTNFLGILLFSNIFFKIFFLISIKTTFALITNKTS